MAIAYATKYNALTIAKYIVCRSAMNGSPVSLLQLNRILYLLQITYAYGFDALLFHDDPVAYPYGPTYLTVYHYYSNWGGRAINETKEVDLILNDQLQDFLDGGIDYLSAQRAPWDQVRITCAPDSPWDIIYNPNGKKAEGYREVIPNELIFDHVLRQRENNADLEN